MLLTSSRFGSWWCSLELKSLPALIFSPQIMNPKGTRHNTQLMRARTVQDHATPRLFNMLSIASGITAPATLLAAAQAASAEEA